MSSNMTGFTDAVYHRKEQYNFGETIFSRRMLKILLLIDGEKTVDQISQALALDTITVMPEFANLVKLGLIQTDGGIISAGVSALFYSDNSLPRSRPMLSGRASSIEY